MKSFVQRHLDVTFQLTSGTFKDGTSDSLTLKGLRVDAKVQSNTNEMGTADIDIYGLSEETINRLLTVRDSRTDGVNQYLLQDNEIIIEAYADGDGAKTVAFRGMILIALADYNAAPEINLHIQAAQSKQKQLFTIAPRSFQGAHGVAEIMEYLAGQIGAAFLNNGVEVVLRDHYLDGDAMTMIEETAKAADIDFYLDGINAPIDSTEGMLLTICPKGVAREDIAGVEMDCTHGQLGYPVLVPSGAVLRVLYNPYFRTGVVIKIVNSNVKRANATFRVGTVKHLLQSETRNGLWETQLNLFYADMEKGQEDKGIYSSADKGV